MIVLDEDSLHMQTILTGCPECTADGGLQRQFHIGVTHYDRGAVTAQFHADHALNLLFRNLGQAVDDNDGYVDKYIGDNLMAIFGLGGERPGVSCRNAVNAASQMLASLPSINTYLRNYLGDEFRLGIGIAFGRMVTGEVGFALKRQFTAIGDTVNIAARLESETRSLHADLLVSDSVKANLMDDFYELKRSFEFDLKGKTEQVKAHEISVLK